MEELELEVGKWAERVARRMQKRGLDVPFHDGRLTDAG